MNKNIVKYFLFFILSFIICESDETVKTDETDKNEVRIYKFEINMFK